MRSRRIQVASTLLLSAALVLAGCGDDGGETPGTTSTSSASVLTTTTVAAASTTTTVAGVVVEVSFRGGQVETATSQVEVDLGETVILRTTSDVADEVHVHTYDERLGLQAGVTGEITFVADIPGRHEVELETRGRRLLTIVVS